jgi:hypothetical protein
MSLEWPPRIPGGLRSHGRISVVTLVAAAVGLLFLQPGLLHADPMLRRLYWCLIAGQLIIAAGLLAYALLPLERAERRGAVRNFRAWTWLWAAELVVSGFYIAMITWPFLFGLVRLFAGPMLGEVFAWFVLPYALMLTIGFGQILVTEPIYWIYQRLARRFDVG